MKKPRLPEIFCAVHTPTGTVRDFKRRGDCDEFIRKHPRYVGVRLVKLQSGDWEPVDDLVDALTPRPASR